MVAYVLQAEFIGTDGSMGLKKGEKYRLDLVCNTNKPMIGAIVMREPGDHFPIPYSTLKSFLDNWKIIKHV